MLKCCCGFEDQGTQMHNKLLLGSINFKMYDAEGQQIYPFEQAMLTRVLQCGITASLKFENQQIIYLSATKPFLASASSN